MARIAHGFIRLLLLAPAFFSSFFLVVGPRLGAKSVFPSGFFRNPRSKITNSTDTALSFDDVLHVQLYRTKQRMQILFSLFSYKAAEFCLCRKSLILNELRRAARPRLVSRLFSMSYEGERDGGDRNRTCFPSIMSRALDQLATPPFFSYHYIRVPCGRF